MSIEHGLPGMQSDRRGIEPRMGCRHGAQRCLSRPGLARGNRRKRHDPEAQPDLVLGLDVVLCLLHSRVGLSHDHGRPGVSAANPCRIALASSAKRGRFRRDSVSPCVTDYGHGQAFGCRRAGIWLLRALSADNASQRGGFKTAARMPSPPRRSIAPSDRNACRRWSAYRLPIGYWGQWK